MSTDTPEEAVILRTILGHNCIPDRGRSRGRASGTRRGLRAVDRRAWSRSRSRGRTGSASGRNKYFGPSLSRAITTYLAQPSDALGGQGRGQVGHLLEQHVNLHARTLFKICGSGTHDQRSSTRHTHACMSVCTHIRTHACMSVCMCACVYTDRYSSITPTLLYRLYLYRHLSSRHRRRYVHRAGMGVLVLKMTASRKVCWS